MVISSSSHIHRSSPPTPPLLLLLLLLVARSLTDSSALPSASSSHAGMRRVAPATGGSAHLDLDVIVNTAALPNGDVYKGHFLAGTPHGRGTYVWAADGCTYHGDWRRGKPSGKGTFTWPSGATYGGDFRDGRMDGHGVFLGPDGATYRGAWAADRRHGAGAKTYANGDRYDGEWRSGLQDGHGRYTWRGGDRYYVGEWRAGVISGRGVLVWANGCRYDGLWENGAPKGAGAFTRPDGIRHLGDRRVDIAGCKRSSVEKAAAVPQICVWDSDGHITCDTVEAFVLCPDGAINLPTPEARRPGKAISKGHKNYDLMLNLQLGIRHAVGKSAAKLTRELKPADFDPREKFWIRFPPEGSKVTPPHSSSEFRWKDYCPMVFRHLRKLFTVDPADYMIAICGDDALRELSSPGKSGSFFFLTQDERFMIKTAKKSEVKLLIRMLPSYYKHVRRYNNSLITRFYGVQSLKPNRGQKVRFIVMGNIFCSEHRIHRRYDLKGSSYGRTSDKFEQEIDETTTLKDLDLNFVFRMQRCWCKELHEQLRRDCEFLESESIMDYSFLVGVHFPDDIPTTKMRLSTLPTFPKLSTNLMPACEGGVGMPELCFSAKDLQKTPNHWKSFIRSGANLPARAERTFRSEIDSCLVGGSGFSTGNKNGETYDVILYFGIIDILRDYDMSKKLEHAYKSLRTDSNSISAVDPRLYSQRFRDYIGKVFIEEG